MCSLNQLVKGHNQQPKEEEGISEVVLFHTRCVVKERCANLTIDESAAVNMMSIEMVEKLGLNIAPLERSYTLKCIECML